MMRLLSSLGLAAVAGLALLLLLAARRGTIPVAHAWNPNSHDKITCYAIEILKEDRKTLFGWFAHQAEQQGSTFFHDQVRGQLRRGSIDEDMNSDLYSALGWLAQMYDTAAAVTSTILFPPAGIVSGFLHLTVPQYGRKTAKGLLKWLDSDTQLVEGTNGGYHFYNPVSCVGLSEPTIVGQVLKRLADCVESPMPHARDRATQVNFLSPFANPWCFDMEGRNYTVDDANRYFLLGYQHLSFYSMGRVLHLLQDMAVPAHIRDDSHLGIPGIENSEPLEYYADYRDFDAHGYDPLSVNRLRWEYDPEREYPVTGQPDHCGKAKELYGSMKDTWRRKAAEQYFDRLAMMTYRAHYSLGTIPGNGDSHDPDATSMVPWTTGGKPDFSKCKPNPEALRKLLHVMAKDADRAYRAYGFPSPPESCTGLIEAAEGWNGEKKTLISLLEGMENLLRELTSAIDHPPPGSTPEREWDEFRDFVAVFRQRYDGLDVPLLVSFLGKQQPLPEAMKGWILAHPSTAGLSRAFTGFHGPCCIINDGETFREPETGGILMGDIRKILIPQYDATESSAIAFTALYLSDWFESQFARARERALILWVNRKLEDEIQVPEPALHEGYRVGGIAQDETFPWPVEDGNLDLVLGISHHLPLEADLEIEFTLEEISDDDLEEFPEGFIVRGLFGRYRPDVRYQMGTRMPETMLEKGKPVKWVIPRTDPCDLAAVSQMELPERGGIRREEEDGKLVPVDASPVYHPIEVEGSEHRPRAKANAAILKLEFREGGTVDAP